jgi:hypothetical protein
MRILCVLLFLSQFTFGQITVESIWKTGEFRTAGVSGFRSMNDGIHFTKISEKSRSPCTRSRIAMAKEKYSFLPTN